MKQEILLPFLQKYTTARPFVMHQNKYEQIDDINRRYIKLYIYDFFRRSDKLKSALMKVDFQSRYLLKSINHLLVFLHGTDLVLLSPL